MLGKAGSIRTAFFETKYRNPNSSLFKLKPEDNLDMSINKWCVENPDLEVIDIKFSTHNEGSIASDGDGDFIGYYNALIIYKI
jgi:hypothetical protein